MLKSIFITAYVTAVYVLLGLGCWQLLETSGWPQLAWVGLVISVIPMALFFGRLFTLFDVARTPAALPAQTFFAAIGSLVALIAAMVSNAPDAMLPMLLAAQHLVALMVYVHWYSRFEDRASSALAVGQPLPPFTLQDLSGRARSSADFRGAVHLMIFYRGNWCPLCQAQIKEVAARYRELADRGVRVLLISPQPEAQSAKLSQRFDAPMEFLVDADNAAAKALGIFAPNGLPATLQALGYDSDTVMPTVVMTDADGTVIYVDLTDNYRVRPEPDDFLRVVDALGADSATA